MLRSRNFIFLQRIALFASSSCLLHLAATAQTAHSLQDLTSFRTPGPSWATAGDVRADLNVANTLVTSGGTGILVNLPDKKKTGTDLFTSFEHGDADIELEYLMAKGSNSGIYLQGNYEIQLMDSWGVSTPKSGDNGGVYQRWDDSKPEGQKGYEGYAPRQSVSRAPGLWQQLKISFQAPRFDASGRKTENARLLRVELNGVTIHENLELFGPTRGAMGPEKRTGPLRIQGDHGPVAIRNFRITQYDKPRPELTNLRYSVYRGLHRQEPDYKKLPPEAEGPSGLLTAGLNNLPDSFLLRYTGVLKVQEPGTYSFRLSTLGGRGLLRINNGVVAPLAERRNEVVTANLPAGDLPFELLYSKMMDWAKPSLGLAVSGPGVREYLISDANSVASEPVDPILVTTPATTLLRSFMDIPGQRVVHAVSVGDPGGVHYTYDMDNGTVVQVWRGGFLDATPMWHERGDGSSRPTGSVQRFGKPVLQLARLDAAAAPWKGDTVSTGFRPKGYVLDEKDRPVFKYLLHGTEVSDAVQVTADNSGIRREITVQQPGPGWYARLAEGKSITEAGANLYLVDDKAYYIRLEETGGGKPVVRDSNGRKELLLPVSGTIRYSILF